MLVIGKWDDCVYNALNVRLAVIVSRENIKPPVTLLVAFSVYRIGSMEETQLLEPNTKILKNGAIYDMTEKRIVGLKPELAEVNTQITQANASVMVKRRQELKQERIMAGAAKVLERTGEWETPTDLDVVEAIAEAVMLNAVDPTSKKQIDAAKFILTEAGLSEQKSQRENAAENSKILASPAALLELVGMIEREKSAAVERARAIDGTTDTRNA